MDMKKIEINLSEPLLERIQKISDVLDIDLNEIIHLCMIDGGISRYWLPIDKLLEDLSELLDREDATDNIHEIKINLAQQFHDRYDIIKDIESLEQKFKKKYKNFNSDLEQNRAFLDFIDTLHDEAVMTSEIIEEPSVPVELPTPPEIPRTPKEPSKAEGIKEFPIRLLRKKHVPLIVFAFFSTLLFFWAIWPYFNFIHILTYTPAYISAYILLFIFSLLVFGGLYSICRYYFRKYQLR